MFLIKPLPWTEVLKEASADLSCHNPYFSICISKHWEGVAVKTVHVAFLFIIIHLVDAVKMILKKSHPPIKLTLPICANIFIREQ